MAFTANLHTQWLRDPVHESLSDKATRVYHASLQFAVEQRNDGRIARVSLRHLHPDGVDGETLRELIVSGLWEASGDEIQIARYELEQPTAERMEKYTADARERKRAERDRKRKQSAPSESPQHVTRESQVTSKEESKKASTEPSEKDVNESTGEVGWNVAQIGAGKKATA